MLVGFDFPEGLHATYPPWHGPTANNRLLAEEKSEEVKHRYHGKDGTRRERECFLFRGLSAFAANFDLPLAPTRLALTAPAAHGTR